MNPEFKHSDSSANSSISSTAGLVLMSGIAQGDSNVTRDGNSVKITGFYGDLTAAMNASATTTRLRTVIFVDMRNQGVAPTASDVIDTASTVQGLPNVDAQPGRFAILFDQVNTMVLASDSRTIHFRFDLTKELRNLHLTYSGTGATVASISGPAIYMLLLSTESTNTPSVVMDARLTFLDN
jgi:hypothetical protein